MATIMTEVSVGEWENRAGLVYVPANDPVPGVWDPGTPGVWQWEEVE